MGSGTKTRVSRFSSPSFPFRAWMSTTSNSWLPTRTVFPIGLSSGKSLLRVSTPSTITLRPKPTSVAEMRRPDPADWLYISLYAGVIPKSRVVVLWRPAEMVRLMSWCGATALTIGSCEIASTSSGVIVRSVAD